MKRNKQLRPKRLRRKFGTTIRQIEGAFKARFGPDHPPHPLFDAPVLLESKTDIHNQLRAGASCYRAGEVLASDDDPRAQEAAADYMRHGVWAQLCAVVAFCHQNMDYRFCQDLGVLSHHADHLLDLMRGVQAPYLMKARPNGNPDPIKKVYQKANCVAARDWLQYCCGFSAKEAAHMVLDRVKDLKKATLEGWGKPHSRAKMQHEIEFACAHLRNVAHMAVRHGDNDIRIVLDRFLEADDPKPEDKVRGPGPSALVGDPAAMHDLLAKVGFGYVDALASSRIPVGD